MLHTESHGPIAVLELRNPPYNFFNLSLLQSLADNLEQIDADGQYRAVVLSASGKTFCAGADFSQEDPAATALPDNAPNPLYLEALRIFSGKKPVIAAIQGAAIGGGLGLALTADFRIGCPESRFSANFNRLGFHPGFGLSATLPRLVGAQNAARLFYTGKRIGGEEALSIGLIDELVDAPEKVLPAAMELANNIAISAPLAVQSTRETLRKGLLETLHDAIVRESVQQASHFRTNDFKEGVQAMADRRVPRFTGS